MQADYRGTSFESFAASMARTPRTPMSDAEYENNLKSLSQKMEHEIGRQIDLNQSLILDLFPGVVRIALRLSWAAMTKIGTFLAVALVGLVLAYLATKTVEEVCEMILKYKRKHSSVNPFPVGVVPPK